MDAQEIVDRLEAEPERTIGEMLTADEIRLLRTTVGVPWVSVAMERPSNVGRGMVRTDLEDVSRERMRLKVARLRMEGWRVA